MSGERDLRRLLAGLAPELVPGEYVITTSASAEGLHPFATIAEDEGLTLVLRREEADSAALPYEYVAARITLRVHSDLAAVGLTAAVSSALAAAGISCNVLAGLHHDRLLVPQDRAQEALTVLVELSRAAAGSAGTSAQARVRPAGPVQVEPATDADVPELATVLVDCVEGGASAASLPARRRLQRRCSGAPRSPRLAPGQRDSRPRGLSSASCSCTRRSCRTARTARTSRSCWCTARRAAVAWRRH